MIAFTITVVLLAACSAGVWWLDRIDHQHGPERCWRREEAHFRAGGEWWGVRRG